MNKTFSEPYSLLAILCVVGVGIMRLDFPTLYYLGVGLTLAGASINLLTKHGKIILAAGVLGNIFLQSSKPIGIAAAFLACWYLFDFLIDKKYKDGAS